MKRAQMWLLIVGLALAGCSGQADDAAEPGSSGGGGSAAAPVGPTGGGQQSPAGANVDAAPQGSTETTEAADQATADATPVPIEDGAVALAPESSRIGFIGVHTDTSRPDRVGGFGKFTGKIEVDGDTIQSIAVEIETDSLSSFNPQLTTHLKSPDFLEAREFPTIQFQSTKVQPGDGDEHKVSGKLTLHGVEKEVEFPARVKLSDGGLVLHSSFVIDRSEYGMDKLLDQVKPEVTITVAVGEKTAPQQAAGIGGRGGRGGGGRAFGGGGGFGGRGGGGFDAGAFFDQRDENKDGKLTGDEISERMRENLEETDTDKDGAISKEEFEARMRQFGGRGGARGGFGGRGGGGFDAGAFFDGLDADDDGKLAGDEIPDRMREGLDEIDTDKDGAISKEEFQARMSQFGRGGRGGFDPDAMFDRLDADDDGKLAGDEIPDPMRDGLDEIDTDKDGSVSKEEFQARMSQFGRGGRGGGPGGGAEGGERRRPESEDPE